MSSAEKLHQFLIENNKTLALAESCTGGFLAARFTAIPDASQYFLGAFITYSNALKQSLLHVSAETLLQSGAASRAAVNEMLLGLMKVSDADFGVATTGIAGPSGGGKEKPVGTVFIALGSRGNKPHVVECHFEGNRQAVIDAACDKALLEMELFIL